MGITRIEFEFLARACERGLLPRGGRLLEIGETRSFVKLNDVVGDPRLRVDEARARALIGEAFAYRDAILGHERYYELFGFFIAKQIYKALFDWREIVSIDYAGSDRAVKADLNEPFSLGETFDVCINCGTTEHIFNQYQAFKTIHDHTADGGVMIHWQPFHGFNHINHGMFLPQPGLFFDLAHANGYAVRYAAVANGDRILEIEAPWVDGGMIRDRLGDVDNYMFVILGKTGNAPFRPPQQYESRVGREVLAQSWEKLQG